MSNERYEVGDGELFNFVKIIGLTSCRIAMRMAHEAQMTHDLVKMGGCIHFTKIGERSKNWLETHKD